MIIPLIALMLGSFLDSTYCLVEQQGQNCPEGYRRGFNNECVKKFVLPKRKKCKEPQLNFGTYKLQLDGRLVKYECEDGWTLVPQSAYSASCRIGQWSKATPQCVRPGCNDLQPPEYGDLAYELDGALAFFTCNINMRIAGESVLGCDGQFWNASVPTCVMTTTPQPPASEAGNWTSGSDIVLVTSRSTTLFCICIMMMYKIAFQ